MDIYALTRSYARDTLIDTYDSAIWTERYRGDGDFELKFPAEETLINVVTPGTILELDGSEQPMISEEQEIEDDVCTTKGITLTKWFNNRFIRSSPDPTATDWFVINFPIGELITRIAQNWLIDSTYLTDRDPYTDVWPTDSMGIAEVAFLKIPGLYISNSATHDSSPAAITPYTGGVKFGPVYDAMRELADLGKLGIKTALHDRGDGTRDLAFSSYAGENHMALSASEEAFLFGPSMENLNDVKELYSLANRLGFVAGYGSGLDPAISANYGGVSLFSGQVNPVDSMITDNPGFGTKAQMVSTQVNAENAITDPFDDSYTKSVYGDIVRAEVAKTLKTNRTIRLIDGQVVAESKLQYGKDYNLGDLVAAKGYTGALVASQVSEYIRSKDSTGEKGFPTLSAYEDLTVFWPGQFDPPAGYSFD